MFMAVNGVYDSSNISNLYNSIFGIGSSKDTGNSFGLSDLTMIQNGSYGKLMKAYYATDKAVKSSESTETKEKEEQAKYVGVKSQAAALNNSLEDLRSASLYEPTGTDENGAAVYDRDKITKSIKDFVSNYNSFIKSTANVDNVSLLRKSVNMVGSTSRNLTMLSKIGITLGENNQLVVNEDKLNSAKLTDISSMFQGSGSYGDSLQSMTRQTYQLANSQAYQSGNGSAYTYSGRYAALGGANGMLDRYL